jgi:hypothetical protein
MQAYFQVTDYLSQTRISLQDDILPYRYTDDQIVDALNHALFEIQRIRPDVFLDLKYQQQVISGDLDDGSPPVYTATSTDYVPVPAKYFMPIRWYMSGLLQMDDVADTQDQRAQAFISKFSQHLLALASG